MEIFNSVYEYNFCVSPSNLLNEMPVYFQKKSKHLRGMGGPGGLVGLVAAHYANSLRTVPGAGSIPVFALGVLSLSESIKNSVCVCLA